MGALYNEIEPFAVEWLRELVRRGVVADGEVDDRSIVEVRPPDVQGRAFHTFAGIGGWAEALRLAGVRADDPRVWTGSCPCQPFSVAGRGRGTADERHLWPEWFRLIDACRPTVVFGEQVASPAGLEWLDAVFADMEGAGYTCAAADLCAAGVGAPHRRQRLYFVAYRVGARLEGLRRHGDDGREPGRIDSEPPGSVGASRRADARDAENRVAFSDGDRREDLGASRVHDHGAAGDDAARRGATRGFWSPAEWIPFRDGKARPVEPGLEPLADGVPNRMGRLRGYGNAIVPQIAAAFVTAALDAIEGGPT